MNVIGLRKLGKLLHEHKITHEESEVMEVVIMLPPPDFYFLDAVKFDSFMHKRFDSFKTYKGSTKQYLVDNFGQDFWDKFEQIAL